MTTDVTLALPQHVYERVAIWSQRTGKSISELLTEVIDESLVPISQSSSATDWSDEEVIRVADLQMSADVDSRLSELFQMQKNADLGVSDRAELRQLMIHYP